MRNLLTLVLLSCLSLPCLAQPDWQPVDLGTTEDFWALHRSGLPWVVGTNGFIASVAADYTTWTVHDAGTDQDLLSVMSPNTTSRFIAGRNGTYIFTDDNGTSWDSVQLPDTTQDYVVVRPNSTFFALGSSGSIYADLIGGAVTWIDRMSPTSSGLNDAESGGFVLAVGNDGTILSANTVGEEWTSVDSGTSTNLNAIARYSADDAWLIVGDGGLILKSTDDGVTWTPRSSGTSANLYAFANFSSGQRFLVVGENGTVMETTDFGESWCHHITGTTETLRAAAVPSSSVWFVAGDSGTMLKSETEGGGNCVPVSIEDGPRALGYSMSAAWPNPSNERTSISLTVDHAQRVTVAVYDLLGRRIATVADLVLPPSSPTTVTIQAAQIPSGSYIIQVQGERFVDSKRITIVH